MPRLQPKGETLGAELLTGFFDQSLVGPSLIWRLFLFILILNDSWFIFKYNLKLKIMEWMIIITGVYLIGVYLASILLCMIMNIWANRVSGAEIVQIYWFLPILNTISIFVLFFSEILPYRRNHE